jgi:putative flippase GtrA
MTLLYVMGATASFLANRRFTFRHRGQIGAAGARYLLAQLSGYLLNLLMLFLFVDWLGFAHQHVQALAILVIALYLFVLSRFFVFARNQPGKGVRRP